MIKIDGEGISELWLDELKSKTIHWTIYRLMLRERQPLKYEKKKTPLFWSVQFREIYFVSLFRANL